MTGPDELTRVLAEIDHLLEEDRAIEALDLVEELWLPDALQPAAHLGLASRGMVAAYTMAEYHDAATWLERTRQHAGPDAQPYLRLLAATFQRLDRLTGGLTRAAPPGGLGGGR